MKVNVKGIQQSYVDVEIEEYVFIDRVMDILKREHGLYSDDYLENGKVMHVAYTEPSCSPDSAIKCERRPAHEGDYRLFETLDYLSQLRARLLQQETYNNPWHYVPGIRRSPTE